MISAPAFPPPNPADPDEIGWPLCTAAAMWRQGRYDESIKHVESAAAAAYTLQHRARGEELAMAAAVLHGYVQRWQQGALDADPLSVPVSADYPSLEMLESVASGEGLTIEDIVNPPEPPATPERIVTNVPHTLPSGIFGEGALPTPKRKLPELKKIFARPAPLPRLVLDFEGSIIAHKPEQRDDDAPPDTMPSDRPPPKK
ncbi:MAG: hypothetical protein HYV09_12775 [Deltaproteobacteria bacterium]|nr:hypothetical protein [Deltaproteobacteria bacterium]